jgi:hypothetical protein
MPLFQFNYDGPKYKFNNTYSIESFDYKKGMPNNIAGLSKLDMKEIKSARWALVANKPNDYYRTEINLLLIAFRCYAASNCYIKWRFCKENSLHSTCLNDKFRNLAILSSNKLSYNDLELIKKGFIKLLEMHTISNRTKITLYFIWESLCENKHIPAYIFLMCALESLFTNDDPKNNTKILIQRIYSFFNKGSIYSKKEITKMYKIRSNMIHGRIVPTSQNDLKRREENIKDLANLEEMVLLCIKKILDEKIYSKYKSNKLRDEYLKALTKNNFKNS